MAVRDIMCNDSGGKTVTVSDPTELSNLQDGREDIDFPEGGLKAWSVVLGAWCAMIPSMGLLNSLGVLHAWTSTHQLKEYSESSIGWIFGAYGFFLYFAGAQTGKSCRLHQFSSVLLTVSTGPIFDTYGPSVVVIPGSFGMVVSLICLSFSEGMSW